MASTGNGTLKASGEIVVPFEGPLETLPGPRVHCWSSARCIAHIDVDCFYAQVEELADPALRFRLLAVIQKNTVITCSLRTRAAIGNIKGLPVTEALRRCPSLYIANGEDLTKYRRLSDRLLQLLQGQPWRGVLPNREEAGGPWGPEGPPSSDYVGRTGSINHPCCCYRLTAAARAAWSAASSIVAAEGGPHPVQRLGLEDFFVDISAASRAATASLVLTLKRTCHSLGGPGPPRSCRCTLCIAISPAQQQPRISGVVLPPTAIRCRCCSCCCSRMPQEIEAQAAAIPSAASTASGQRAFSVEPLGDHVNNKCSSCCEWELLCPAFVYDGRDEKEGARSTKDSNTRNRSRRDSAAGLLQRPLRLAPLVSLLLENAGLLTVPVAALLSSGEASVQANEGLQEQSDLIQAEQLPKQQRPLGGSACKSGVNEDLSASLQGSSHPQGEQRQQEDAAVLCSGDSGDDCHCGVQRLLLVVAAHLTEAMRGLIFSTFGGLTTTGGICSNKSLAKMASKEHKPSQQTLLLREHRRRFLADKPLLSVPGIGAATARRLAAAHVRTCKELLQMPPRNLAWILSDAGPLSSSLPPGRESHQQLQPGLRSSAGVCTPSRTSAAHAQRLRLSCMGDEGEPVQDSSCAFKTVTAEDSYAARPIATWQFLREEIKRLVRRLLQRHEEIARQFGLVASSLRVSIRLRENYQRISRSASLPPPVRRLLMASIRQRHLPPGLCSHSPGESNSAIEQLVDGGGCCETPALEPDAEQRHKQEISTAGLPVSESPLHVGLAALALHLFKRTFVASLGPVQDCLNEVIVLSLTFVGFKPYGTPKTPSPGARGKDLSAGVCTLEAFLKRRNASPDQRRQKRERNSSKEGGSRPPSPACALRRTRAVGEQTADETNDGFEGGTSLGDTFLEIPSTTNGGLSRPQRASGVGSRRRKEVATLPAGAPVACAWAASDSPVEVISLSSREPSPGPRPHLPPSHADGSRKCSGKPGPATHAVLHAAQGHATDDEEVVELVDYIPTEDRGHWDRRLQDLSSSPPASRVVEVVESQEAVEEPTRYQPTGKAEPDQGRADHGTQQPHKNGSGRQKGPDIPGKISPLWSKSLAPELQGRLRGGRNRQLQGHNKKPTVGAPRGRMRDAPRAVLDLTHYFAPK